MNQILMPEAKVTPARLDDRTRLLNCFSFKPVDRPPRWEWAFRKDATVKWRQQGLPADVPRERSWTEYFDLDRGNGYPGSECAEQMGVRSNLMPDFQSGPISEDARSRIEISEWGGKVRVSKIGESIPQYLDFGLKTPADFAKYRERWDPRTPGRLPADWKARVARWATRDYPVCAYAHGWYGLLRELMGVEELSLAFYDEEALIDEVCEFWADFLIDLFDELLRDVRLDYFLFWEDLAGKSGSLVSPDHFRRFFLKPYRRVIEALRKRGVANIMVDSDGFIDPMIPCWIDAGVNVLGPFEVAAGMDVVAVREKYGRDLAIVGGIDKMEIAKGPDAIRAEVDLRVRPMLAQGGYIPTLDHATIPELSLSDYRYYREYLRELCEAG